MTITERFWAKVQKGPHCWEWQAAHNEHGYGLIGLGRRLIKAHRLSWTVANGPIPPGMWVLHRCDNPACVRPDHLFLGTAKDNSQDMWRKGRGSKPPVRRGLANNKSKVTDEQVQAIRERLKDMPSRRRGRVAFKAALARQYGLADYHSIDSLMRQRKEANVIAE